MLCLFATMFHVTIISCFEIVRVSVAIFFRVSGFAFI